MLSQFTPQEGKMCLADLPFKFPKNIYPVGRLDHDSEGLLLLTNDKRVNNALLSPENHHQKTYLIQVEGKPSAGAIKLLESGVEIKSKGTSLVTKKAKANVVPPPSWLGERNPPVKQNLEKSWIELTITEGKNRQVRKMTAAVGHPTLRLIRTAIEDISINGLLPNQVMELSQNTAFKKLKLSFND